MPRPEESHSIQADRAVDGRGPSWGLGIRPPDGAGLQDRPADQLQLLSGEGQMLGSPSPWGPDGEGGRAF